MSLTGNCPISETALLAGAKDRSLSAMQLALSVRIAEAPKRKDIAAVPFDELAAWAKAVGFDGLSLRASVVSVQSSAEQVRQVRRHLDTLGLQASMVTGDLALAVNNAAATAAVRNITPYLDLAEALGASLLRVMLHGEADIAPAQIAADEAAERAISLSHQTHWGSLFETVGDALEVLRRIGRENFGVTYEAANLMACGSIFGADAIDRLGPYLMNVYFQNIRLDARSPTTFETRRKGRVPVRFIPLDDPSGIDPRPLIERLQHIAYDGWFTVHQPLLAGQTVEGAIREAAEFFRPLISRTDTSA